MSSTPADYARRKARLMAKGKCTKCASRDAVPGKTRCSSCNDRDKARNRSALAREVAAIQARKEAAPRRPTSECQRCFEPHAPGDELCHDCRRVQDELEEERERGEWL